MDSNSRVVQNQVQENDEHRVDSQQVAHGEEIQQHDNEEKSSVFDRMKAKAKKIKDTIKNHGHNVLDQDKDEDQQVHELPIHETEAVRSAAPTSEKVENLGKSEDNFEGATVEGKETHHKPRVLDVSSTNEIDQNITTDQGKTFVGEEKSEHPKVNLERPIGLEEDPPKYNQTEVTDLTGTGTAEIDIAPIEKSFERMNVQDEQEKVTESRAEAYTAPKYHQTEVTDLTGADFSTAAKTQYPSDGSHDQFDPETISTSTNRNHEISEVTEQTFNNTATTKVEEQPNYDTVEKPSNVSNYTDKSGDASNKSGSTAEYGKNIAQSLTEKLDPVDGEVAEVGSAVKPKVSGTGTTGAETETETENEVKEEKKGVSSVKDYLADKLRPGEEDKALSEVISEALQKPKKDSEDDNEKPEKVSEESSVHSPGKGVVDRLKGVVGSWFGKPEENQSTQGDEGLSKSDNSGVEVEQVNKAEG